MDRTKVRSVWSVDGLELDPEAAARQRAERDRQVNALHIPRLRVVGFALIMVFIWLHNRFFLGAVDAPALWRFGGLVGAYCALSWAILGRWYGRSRRLDLGVTFLALDVVLWTAGIYISGAERSWLFPLALARVSDLTGTTFRRALAFAHLAPALYLVMLLYAEQWGGHDVPWARELSKAAFVYGVGVYIALTARVTESLRRKTAEAVRLARDLIALLEEEKHAANRASEAKSSFLAGVSHEMRTPLNAISLYLELLDEQAQELDQAEMRSDIERIRGSASHLLQLVNDLLDIAKIEAGKLDLVPETFDLPDLVEEVESTMRPLLEKKENALAKDMAGDLPTVHADRTRVRQVLFNLMSNASKFTEHGTVTLRIACQPDRVDFEVQDTGIGMTPEQLGRIFQPFVQAEATTAKKFGGTGLGLVLSRQLCELMGGGIEVASEAGRGSRFHFWIPLEAPMNRAA